ncbi:helix-turn-helix transcriptional regulator [Bifidobacterium sp.]|uniref:helix-turn-helix domain-containing protein n=1 Tax=Bifidobacterium sp. TaxID=41200 RepID=UPI00257F7077|nr:helix-turn-helix transcriptional regulator [Bifidobacterium sp.]
MKISSEANSASANELQETITKNVRVLIAAKSVNQEDLAEALGIAQSGLSRKVNRRTDWSSSDIANLASFFGISFADIVTPLPLFLPSGGADYYVHPNSSYIDPRAQQMQQRDLAVPAGVRYLRMPVEGEERIHGAVGPRAFVMPSPDSDLDGPGGLGPRFSARTRVPKTHEVPGKTI